jgi:hypothetical protein
MLTLSFLTHVLRELGNLNVYLEHFTDLQQCCVPAQSEYLEEIRAKLYSQRLKFVSQTRIDQSETLLTEFRTHWRFDEPDSVYVTLGGCSLCSCCHRKVYRLSEEVPYAMESLESRSNTHSL